MRIISFSIVNLLLYPIYHTLQPYFWPLEKQFSLEQKQLLFLREFKLKGNQPTEAEWSIKLAFRNKTKKSQKRF